MKIKKQTIIGMILVALGIIPLFFTKDLGTTTVFSAIGVYLIKTGYTDWFENICDIINEESLKN